jgi:hypothetical protein
VLADAVSGEALQTVPWRHAELVQSLGGVHKQQLAVRSSLHVRCQLARPLPLKHLPCLGVPEGSNHRGSVTRSINSVNRYYRGAQRNKALELTSRRPEVCQAGRPPGSGGRHAGRPAVGSGSFTGSRQLNANPLARIIHEG